MTGWSGGRENRRWRRGQGDDTARIALLSDVARILGKFRAEHGYQDGFVWNPYLGVYEDPEKAEGQA